MLLLNCTQGFGIPGEFVFFGGEGGAPLFSTKVTRHVLVLATFYPFSAVVTGCCSHRNLRPNAAAPRGNDQPL